MNAMALWILWLVIGYVAGSVPFGLLIARWQGVDLRAVGSGNIGATNVGRALGKKWGLLCFALDVGKGLAPVVSYGIASGLIGGAGAAGMAGTFGALGWLSVVAAAIAGHVFPVWLGFRGGKGVATALGALLGVWPMLTLSAIGAAVVWLGVVLLSGYVSLASIFAAVVLPAFALGSGLLLGRPAAEVGVYVAVTAALAGLVVFRHRTNLARLRAGTETKVGWAGRR